MPGPSDERVHKVLDLAFGSVGHEGRSKFWHYLRAAGLAIVPVEPTEAMIEAGATALHGYPIFLDEMREVLTAALAATQEPASDA